ncbi:MAG: hypothetical protein JWN18_414 [Parcubacteria group bacterium]|nr:hypothetical protein [Parcubacteria group bacterium]
MVSDESIGKEFGLTQAQTAALLHDDPAWALHIGLENFQSNGPMADFLRRKIANAESDITA